MPLPTTGPLSIVNIRDEFNTALSSAPHSLSEYYAGLSGGPVAAGVAGINGPIPSAGDPISISHFRGAPISAPTVDHVIIAKDTPGPNDTSAGVIISNNGFLYASATKTTTGTGRFISINGTQYTNNIQTIMLTPAWVNTSLGATSDYSFRAYWTPNTGTEVPVASTGTGTCTPVQTVNSGNWTDLLCSRSVILSSQNSDNDGTLTLEFALNTNLSAVVKTVIFSLAALSAP